MPVGVLRGSAGCAPELRYRHRVAPSPDLRCLGRPLTGGMEMELTCKALASIDDASCWTWR